MALERIAHRKGSIDSFPGMSDSVLRAASSTGESVPHKSVSRGWRAAN